MQVSINEKGKTRKTWKELLGDAKMAQIQNIKNLTIPNKVPIFQTADDEVYLDVDKGTERYKHHIYRNVIDANVEVLTDGILKKETNKTSSNSEQTMIEVSNYTYIIMRFKSSAGAPIKDTVLMKDYISSMYLKSLFGVV